MRVCFKRDITIFLTTTIYTFTIDTERNFLLPGHRIELISLLLQAGFFLSGTHSANLPIKHIN